jgi:hypothetical protein
VSETSRERSPICVRAGSGGKSFKTTVANSQTLENRNVIVPAFPKELRPWWRVDGARSVSIEPLPIRKCKPDTER